MGFELYDIKPKNNPKTGLQTIYTLKMLSMSILSTFKGAQFELVSMVPPHNALADIVYNRAGCNSIGCWLELKYVNEADA